LHQIGVGVLGPVYRAQDTVRDQLVAVKVFKVDAPPEQAEQIAEALQAVVQALPRHRGLVEFIAAGVERDTAYLVMAHSDVPSLDSRLKPGASADSSTTPVDAEQALVIVRTLAEAMDAAHARGIVHGGLHPRDIFVDDRGVCRAAGFGVATALERAGVKVPVRRPYSPPERLTSAPIEPPADRFALGAIAFELLTGRRIAGTGSNAAARFNASVPGADLDAVRNALAAMLAEQPAHRPSTANAFAQALSLALFPQGVARASAAAAATAANRSPAAAARDDRRDANTAPGLGGTSGPGTTAGAIGAAASNLSRDSDSDGPSPDDLELFTREGLFTGQPRQNSLRWEPVEVENVVPPGEDPLELFAPSPNTELPAEPEAEVASASADSTPVASEAHGDVKEARSDVEADAAPEVPEVPVKRLDSILGLSTTIVGPFERDEVTPAKDVSTSSEQPPASPAASAATPASSARDERPNGRHDEGYGDDEGHETTALPFVPIRADARLSPSSASSPLSSRLHDSVLIDDNSRLDALDRADHVDHVDHLDRLDHFDRHDDVGDIDHLGDIGGIADRDDSDDADESSMTPAAAAAAGVIAAGGVPAGAADLSASHSAHYSHASHASHGADTSETSRLSAARGDRASGDRTQSSFDREAREAETWVAPAAAPVTPPSSILTNPPETSDVGSSIRVVGLVLALGLAVGGAGGYLLGQRSSLRNASAFDQTAGSGDAGAARPAAGGDQAGGASAGAAGNAAAPGTDVALPAANAPSARPDSARDRGASAAGSAPGATAATAPAGASPSTGASRPAAATGRLTINSTPARADVAIDGVRRGVTPLTLRDLPFGSHTVRVTRGGFAPETRRVNIVAGRPAESISIDLEPTAPRTRPSSPGAGPAAAAATPAPERGSASGLGALYVVSRPMGARVTVDGRLVGATPLLLTDVSSGSHTIQLQADGHKPWQTTVQVKMGERTRVAASLEEGR
jgi:serine/threonine protein kinase